MRTLYDDLLDRIRDDRTAERLIETLDILFERPIVTIRQIEAELEVPYRSASRYVEKFTRLGILREITGQARNRIFRADGILRAIEE